MLDRIKIGDEIINPKVGRKPGKRGVEKRTEEALIASTKPKDKRVKSNVGRKAFTYDNRPEHIKFIIDSAAMGYSSTRIRLLLIERYGEGAEQVVTLSSINTHKKRYAGEINEREKALRSEIAGMLPSNRMRFLQRVIDDAAAGEPFLDKEGNVYHKQNLPVIVQAVKEMNAMMKDIESQKGVGEDESRVAREISEQKEVIREWVVEQMKLTGRTELEVLQEVTKELGADYMEAVKELETEYRM